MEPSLIPETADAPSAGDHPSLDVDKVNIAPDESDSASNDNSEGGAADKASKKKRKANDDDTIQQLPDPAMELTTQERQWALETKRAFEEDDDIIARSFTDMQIATYAIIDQGDIGRSVERAQCFQAFRMDYNINDTAEEGIQIMRLQNQFCPGMLLSLEECSNEDGYGAHALIIHLAKYFPLRFLEHPKNFRANIGSMYYQIRCTQADFRSVRNGFRQIIEMEGVGWTNFSFQVERKALVELLGHLPYQRKQVQCLRPPSIAVLTLSLMKPFLAEHKAFLFGTKELQEEFPTPIDNLYLQPNPEEAFDSLMKRCEQMLQKRANNEAAFRL